MADARETCAIAKNHSNANPPRRVKATFRSGCKLTALFVIAGNQTERARARTKIPVFSKGRGLYEKDNAKSDV